MEMLSQSEVDQLIAQLASGLPAKAGERPKRDEVGIGTVRLYDFRRPDKFSKDQLRTIQMVHDGMARQLTGFLASKTRTVVQLFITSVDQMTYAEFLRGVSNPGIIGVINMAPLNGTALLEITPNVGFPIIDRLLGGPGHAMQKARALTEIEITVIESIVRGVIASLKESWKNIIDLKASLETIETNPLFVQVIAPNEVVVVVSVETRVGDSAGAMNLCLPYLCIEPVLPRLSAHQWFSSAQRSGQKEADGIAVGLCEVPLSITAELGDAEITVEELLNLEPGDVVELRQRVDEPVRVIVDGRYKLWGNAVRRGKKLAVVISKAVGE